MHPTALAAGLRAYFLNRLPEAERSVGDGKFGSRPLRWDDLSPPLLRNELSASLIHVFCIAPDTLQRFFCDYLAHIGALFAKLCDMFQKSADSSYMV